MGRELSRRVVMTAAHRQNLPMRGAFRRESYSRMPRTERRRERELRILNGIAEALNSAPDVREALERTLAAVAELLHLRTGWIWLLDPATQQFYNVTVQNLPPYLQQPVQMAGRACYCIDAFREGKLTPKNVDVMECSRLCGAVNTQDEPLTEGLRYHASIPLVFQGKQLGIMNVTGPSWRRLTRGELGLLSTIAYQVGIAVERARLAEESARLARAEERARIAREIHDALAQGLTAIGLQIESALNRLDIDPEGARHRMERALETTRTSLEDARGSIADLRMAPLVGKPLAEALGALARAFTADTGIRVRVQALGACSLPLHVEVELYRIAQEALANVARHAAASDVILLLRTTPNRLRLTICDNGRGMPSAPPAENCHGLDGMRERARLLGGTLRMTGRSGRGTTVTVTAPLVKP